MKSLNTILIAATLLASGIATAQETPDQEPLMANELIEKMAPHLISAEGEARSVPLQEKDYVLVYWSASWCGPCRKFTPQLIDYYKKNGGGDTFEIVLICLDRSEDKMMKYMRAYNMPWPAVVYDKKQDIGAKSFAKGGIPRLMIINKKGEVITRGNGWAVLRTFKKLVGQDS